MPNGTQSERILRDSAPKPKFAPCSASGSSAAQVIAPGLRAEVSATTSDDQSRGALSADARVIAPGPSASDPTQELNASELCGGASRRKGLACSACAAAAAVAAAAAHPRRTLLSLSSRCHVQQIRIRRLAWRLPWRCLLGLRSRLPWLPTQAAWPSPLRPLRQISTARAPRSVFDCSVACQFDAHPDGVA